MGDMQHRRLRAPANHGQRLIDPPLSEAPGLVADNRAHLPPPGKLWDRSFDGLVRPARHDLLAAARRFTSCYSDPPAVPRSHPASSPPAAGELLSEGDRETWRKSSSSPPDLPAVILAGHQPQLFHPGVWYKNFVLDRVANRAGATAVNLLIDNDVAAHSAIRVPTGSVDAPRLTTVPFDQPQPGVPFEACRLRDGPLFASFATRVREAVRPFSPEPLVEQLWPLARLAAQRTPLVHRCLAEARHVTELEWGLSTLELPLSQVCRQSAFREFAAHFLIHAARFRAEHNGALAAYRRVNRIRSKTHPVPELTQQDGWCESPFWVWSEDDPRRRPLLVRSPGGRVELSNRGNLVWRDTPLHDGARAEDAVAFLAEIEDQGIKIRPRALTTTMFCRLFLSDLFIHGIGGAKYDQLTDEMIRRFFGLQAPKFLVVTATAHLPIERPHVDETTLRALRRRLREFRFHPERHLEVTPVTAPLIEEKRTWINDQMADRRARHLAITGLNEMLGRLLEKSAWKTSQRITAVEAALARERILGSREYSFCLFSKPTLQSLLLDI